MILETNNSENVFWLVKLPSFLKERIENNPNDTVIGELSIGNNGAISFSVASSLVSRGFPSDYTVSCVNKSEKMYFMKDDAIEGYSVKELFINPVHNEVYYEFVRNRDKLKAKEPEINVFNYKTEGKTGKGFISLADVEFIAKNRKRLLQAKKRERLDKTEVIDMIFRAFEKHAQWSVRDLADFTGQPLAYIQELLPDICNVNKKDHKGLFELKPEFRSGK